MPFPLKLAWKYFRSTRKGLVRFTAIVAVTGIAAGVASLIVAQALAKGFADEISEKILINTAHITLTEKSDAKISNWQIVKRTVEKIDGIENVIPTVYESAVLSSGERSGYAVLKVKNEPGKAPARLISGKKADEHIEISLGSELGRKLKLKIGDEADIITLGQNEKPESSKARVGKIFETGLYEYDSTWIYISESNYLKLKNQDKFSPTVFSVFVKDIFGADKIAGEIRRRSGEHFRVLDWREANKPLFSALSLEKKVSFAIILLIIFIAVLNVTTTLALLVNERKLDIAILRTCGATSGAIVMVFLVEGIILSLAGIVSGMIAGIGACFLGNYFRIVRLSTEVYSINSVSFHIDVTGVLMIGLATLSLAIAAVFLPALKASKIKPLENIRSN